MKKYFCDVCGSEITGAPEFAPELGNKAVEVCGLEDLCSRCCRLAQQLSVAELVLSELRRLGSLEDCRTGCSAKPNDGPQGSPLEARQMASPVSPPPEPTGRGAKEKRAVLRAIERFRQKHGPGAISALSDLAKIDESVVRDMVTCQKVPMASWRAVGKALGVSKSGTGGAE